VDKYGGGLGVFREEFEAQSNTTEKQPIVMAAKSGGFETATHLRREEFS
jgi:hypothetical protein